MIIELFIFMITGSIHVYRSLLGGFITPNPLGWVLKKIFSFGRIKNDIYAGVANKQNAPFYKLCPKTQPLHTPNGQKWFWCILSLSNFFFGQLVKVFHHSRYYKRSPLQNQTKCPKIFFGYIKLSFVL